MNYFLVQSAMQEGWRHPVHDPRLPLLQPGFDHQRRGCWGYRARERERNED